MQGGTSKAGFKNNDRLPEKQKKGKKIKDPNRPKRPPSPFFVFMEGFRKRFKEQNPAVKGLAAMGKAGGDKWRSMSSDDKAEFVTVAEQRQKDYEKTMKVYENMLAGGNEEEESDKSKSEVNNEEDKEGKGVNFNWNMEKKKRGRFYKRKKKIYDLGAENSEEIVKKRIDRGQEICVVSTSSDDEESEKVESFDGSRKRIIRANSNGKKGSSDSECGDSGEKDEGFVQENDRVVGYLDEEGEVRKIRALFKKVIVDVESEDIDNMGGSGDQDIRDETEIIERSGKQKKANYEEIELRRSQREEDVIIKNVYNTKLDESFPEDDRLPNRCKKSSTNKDGEENCRSRTRGQNNKETDTSKVGLTSLEGGADCKRKSGGRIDENGDLLSVMCHQCQKNDKGQVVICANCKWKQNWGLSMTRRENSFQSWKSFNSSSKVAGQSSESDTKSVPSTSDKVVKDCRQGSSAMEDLPSEKGGKEVHTSNKATTSRVDSVKQFVEAMQMYSFFTLFAFYLLFTSLQVLNELQVIPNTTSMGQPIYTPSTSHDSPNISHQTALSIPTETVGFFKQLADMLQGNKSDWVLPPQIQLDEQTIRNYEQLLKTGLSGDLRDLHKDSAYQEFNEALTGLLACRRIPSNLHQGFLSLRRDLPSIASRVFELNKEIARGMLQRVNLSTMKELESSLHKYRKCEEHVLKLEQEKECNVTEIRRLKARNQVIDSEIATYTAEADGLQKSSAAQSLKIANVDVAGALNESTLQRSLDDLANMENEWRKRVDTLDF